MMHWRANRLLASLPDGTLPEETELEVRVHVASCASCRHQLHELEAAEDVLLRMPASIVPLEWSPNDYQRLVSLARWSNDPMPPDPERWRAPILSLAGVLAIFTMALMVGRYSPFFDYVPGPGSMKIYQPDATFVPESWR